MIFKPTVRGEGPHAGQGPSDTGTIPPVRAKTAPLWSSEL